MYGYRGLFARLLGIAPSGLFWLAAMVQLVYLLISMVTQAYGNPFRNAIPYLPALGIVYLFLAVGYVFVRVYERTFA